VSLNGTIADEAVVLRVCLHALGIGSKQVVHAWTDQHRSVGSPEDESARAVAYLRKKLKGLQEETLGDFLAKNKERHLVAPDLTLAGRLVCIADEDLRHIFRDYQGWERFRETYPDSRGTVGFSRVGFNPALTQGLVYAGIQADWLTGQGAYWLYSRSPGGWVELASAMAWIS
jgi:hypothetical protein